MKLKTAQIIEVYNWAMSMRKKDIPYTAAFLITSNINNMDGVVKNFEEQKLSMLEKYGKKDSEGKLKIDENKMAELEDTETFNAEIVNLLECEVDILVNKIPMEEMKNLSIPIEKMRAISFMFVSPQIVME